MPRLSAIVIGSAAGGGFPQWNCRCAVCRLAWDGDPCVTPRTQASLAASADGRSWVLLNASPDLRSQIAATPALHPRDGVRDSPIAAVILTGAEIDQIAGLLTLRERQRLALYATAETLATIAANPIFDALARDVVLRHVVALGEPFFPVEGIEAVAFAVPGKVPLFLEGTTVDLRREDATNIGIELRAGGTRLVYVPGAAAITPMLLDHCRRADVVLFDGALFRDDEMIAAGAGEKTGQRMGHMPIAGEAGLLAALTGLSARRIFIHINNTNPILVAGSPERREVEDAGWEVGEDGMRIDL